MAGLGFLGNGGSSSSSNLSALAQPFNVDRSLAKPNSNPIVSLSEATYASSFNPSVHNWQNPTCIPNFSAGLGSEIVSTHLTSSNPYIFSGSLSVHLPTTLPPVSPNPAPTTESFSYAQCSDSLITSSVQTKPYYPQYAPHAALESSPLVALNESGYDRLATSSVPSLTGSYQDDYTRSLSGLDYPGRWDSFWSGLEDGFGSKVEQSFGPEKKIVAGPSMYNTYLNKGAAATEGLSRREDASAVLDRKCIDSHGIPSCSGPFTTEPFYGKSFGNSLFTPSESSGASDLGSTLVFPEISPNASSLGLISNSLYGQKPYNALHEKSSPTVVIRPPTPGTNFSAAKAHSSRSRKEGYSDEFAGYNPSDSKGSHHVPGCKRKEVCMYGSEPSIDMDSNDPVLFKSSAMEKKMLNTMLVSKDAGNQMSKAKFELKVPHINGSGNIQPAVIDEAVDSALDYFDPTVDSPCWKGAPSSHLSTFEVSKDTPEPFIKRLQSCNDSTLLWPLACSLNTDDAVKVSSQKSNESTKDHSSPSPRRPLVVNASSGIQRLGDAVAVGFNDQNLSSGSRVLSPDYIHEMRKDYALDNLKGDSNFKSQPRPEGGQSACENKVALGTGFVQINATESPSHLLCPGEDVSVKLANLHEEKPTPKMNVQMLIDAIHNLSELLFFNCSTEACSLKEHDRESLKHVINNLDSCLLKNVGQRFLKEGPCIPQHGGSNFLGDVTDMCKVVSEGTPLMKEVAANFENQHVHEETKLYSMSCEKDEGLSLKDVADIRKDDGMTKVIKKILHDNFLDEEEKSPHTLLYKDLWLEAEAALCSINYRARFDRVKSEMQNFRFQKAKVVSGRTQAEENLSSSKVSHDASSVEKSASGAKDTLAQKKSIQDSTISGAVGLVDDVEASVMARFNILKCRGDGSKSVNIGGKLLPEVIGHGFTDVSEKNVAGENLLSSNISHNARTIEKSAFEAEDSPNRDISIQDSPVSGTTGDVDNVEASAMARFQILKCRGESSNSMESMDAGRQLLAEVVDHVFTGDRLQYRVGNKLGQQLPAGCYDSSSSEWEHVLKEELQW